MLKTDGSGDEVLIQQLLFASQCNLQVIPQPGLRTTPLRAPVRVFCAAGRTLTL